MHRQAVWGQSLDEAAGSAGPAARHPECQDRDRQHALAGTVRKLSMGCQQRGREMFGLQTVAAVMARGRMVQPPQRVLGVVQSRG